MRAEGRGSRLILHTVLILGAVAVFIPLGWMVLTAIRPGSQTFVPLSDPRAWDVSQWSLRNFSEIFDVSVMNFGRCLRNTSLITFLNVIGTVFFSAGAAYGFAFLSSPKRDWLFYGVLSTMMLPGVVVMIPVYVLFRWLHWVDTLKPLIVPAFFGSAFAIFLFRQFFRTLPGALVDAALIDGATHFEIFTRIVLPLSKPAVATITIFTFMGSWNDFMGPLIYLNSQENWTLALGLSSFVGLRQSDWHLLMAASLLVMLPVVVVFFLAQRHFIRGIAAVGVKG
jgi:ABC-type glycerol-3-phosphate transport system permease component